jgi:hypothetical protein
MTQKTSGAAASQVDEPAAWAAFPEDSSETGVTALNREAVEEVAAKLGWKVVPLYRAPRWIPVDERLPEIDRDVLLTDGEEVVMAWLAEDGWQTWNASQNWRGARAWMPLPEPPQN